MAASVLLAALLCEAALRLLFPKYFGAAAGWMPSDSMRIFAPAPNTREWAFHPDTGRRHPFHHNNLGLRQHRNFSDADVVSSTTVGVFGDSFVHMPWLDAPYVFTEPLDYLLNLDANFNVLNFGVRGYGPAQSYFAYRGFRAKEALDYVLFVYYGGNDLHDLSRNRLLDLDDSGLLRQREARGSAWWVPFAAKLHLTYLALDATGRLAPYIGGATAQLQTDFYARLLGGNLPTGLDNLAFSLEVFEQLMHRWSREVRESGGEFLVVFLPTQRDYPLERSLLEDLGIGLVDLNACYEGRDEQAVATGATWRELLHRAFNDEHWWPRAWYDWRYWQESPYSFRNDNHWNELANRLAAACLDERLRREAGLPAMADTVRKAALAEYYAAFESPSPGRSREKGNAGRHSQERSLPSRELIRRKYQALGEGASDFYPSPRQLVVESNHYSVYLHSQRYLIFAKDCHADAVASGLFAHANPVDSGILPPGRVSARLRLARRRYVQEGACMRIFELPLFPISRILVGQRNRTDSPTGPILWSGEIVLDRTAFENAMEEMLSAAGEPVIESDMNVHVHDRRIFYVSDDCRNTDGRTPFLLHVTPMRAADLAQDRIEHGYNNLDFHQVGATVGARCVVGWRLPDYPIRHIRTGQYVVAGVAGDGLLLLWEGEADIGG